MEKEKGDMIVRGSQPARKVGWQEDSLKVKR